MARCHQTPHQQLLRDHLGRFPQQWPINHRPFLLHHIRPTVNSDNIAEATARNSVSAAIAATNVPLTNVWQVKLNYGLVTGNFGVKRPSQLNKVTAPGANKTTSENGETLTLLPADRILPTSNYTTVACYIGDVREPSILYKTFLKGSARLWSANTGNYGFVNAIRPSPDRLWLLADPSSCLLAQYRTTLPSPRVATSISSTTSTPLLNNLNHNVIIAAREAKSLK